MSPQSSHHPTILIADNDPGVAMMLTQMLKRDGFEHVECVEDGARALQRLQLEGSPVDLLICDLDMPGLSGEELLALLGEWETAPAVLVVSAYLDESIERDLAKSSALCGTLAKPFDFGEFLTKVRAALADDEPSESAAEQGGLF